MLSYAFSSVAIKQLLSALFFFFGILPIASWAQQPSIEDRWTPGSYVVQGQSSGPYRTSAATAKALCDKIVAIANSDVVGGVYNGTLTRHIDEFTYYWTCDLRFGAQTAFQSYSLEPWCKSPPEYSSQPLLPGYSYVGYKGISEDYCTCGAATSPWLSGMPMFDSSVGLCQNSYGVCSEWAKSSCFAQIERLQSAMPPTGDPRSVFHKTQTCIAGQACLDGCRNTNCKWIGKTIVDFVQPYLEKAGAWRAIDTGCMVASFASPKALSDRLCALSMALYHISADLENSTITNGCGSDADWSRVYGRIKECAATTGFTAGERQLVNVTVFVAREQTRRACTAAREAQGLNVEVSAQLQGQSCAVSP
jgi:hypothetical protein